MSPKKVRAILLEQQKAARKAKRKIRQEKKKGKKTKGPSSLDVAKLINRDDFYEWAQTVGFQLHYRPTAIEAELAGRSTWEDFEVIRTATSKQTPHRRGYKPAGITRKKRLGKLGLPAEIIERIDYDDQESFIETLTTMGMTERQAYALWHSP